MRRGRATHASWAARVLRLGQVEAGHKLPISMTYASVPALRAHPGAGPSMYEPLLAARSYDFGVCCEPARQERPDRGMSMTEEQADSDSPGQHTHTAEPQADGTYRSPATSGSPPPRCPTCS
ncbi:hypothetical protein [Kitasatospora albolonga]|uniref:hypothetical protein n=1 Tax=Kitasatospora albolonga TaxID=68173 RepID=UPI003CD0C256